MARVLKTSIILESIANTEGFSKFNASMGRTQDTLKKMQPGLTAIAGGFAAVSAAAVATGAAVMGSINHASGLKDMADQANVSTDALQTLGYVAVQNGADLEAMTKALVHAQSKAADAAAGNEAAAKSFARLGINARTFAELRPEMQLERLGRAANAAKGSQEALAAVMDILGAKNAPKLMASLRELGAEGFINLAADAAKAGQVLSSEAIASMDKAGDRVELLKNRFKILRDELINYAADSASAIAGRVSLSLEQKLSETERNLGLNHVNTSRARIDYAEALLKEGKVKAALIEYNRTLAFSEKRFETADGKEIISYNELRGRLAFQLNKSLKDQGKAELEAADAAEAAGLKSARAAELSAKNRELTFKRNAEAGESYRTEVGKRATAREQREQAERLRIVTAHEAAIAAVQGREVNEYQRRGLSLGGGGLSGAAPSALGIPQPLGFVMPTPESMIPRGGLSPAPNGGEVGARILQSIDSTLKLIATREVGLA